MIDPVKDEEKVKTLHGTALDRFVTKYGLQRIKNTASTGHVKIRNYMTSTPVLLLPHTRFWAEFHPDKKTPVFHNDGYYSVPPMEEMVLNVTACEKGSFANLSFPRLITHMEEIHGLVLSDSSVTTGGTDTETDPSLRARVLIEIDSRKAKSYVVGR